MLLILTGNGKGKTTSAIGSAIRAAGWNKKTAIVFFDKGGVHYGEQKVLQKLQPLIEIFRFGKERFDVAAQTFRFENTAADLAEAEAAQKKVLELFKEHYFLIICDEIINCLNLKLLSEAAVREVVERVPKETHLMLTGRNLPQWLAEKADLISEIQEKKHHYRKVKKAMEGIDF